MNAEDVTAGLDTVGRGPCFAVARNADVIVIHLWDQITDDVGTAWRAVAQASYDKEGYPPFGFVYAIDGNSVGTLQGKVRSAAFMRTSAAAMKRIGLVSNVQGSFVIKSVMRVAGAKNVELVSPDACDAVLSAMKAGRDPFA